MNKTIILNSLLACVIFTFCQLAFASNNNGILEVVIFSSKPKFSNQQIIKKAKSVTTILQSYPGFISRKFSESTKEKNQWLDIVHWASLHEALMAANKIAKTAQMEKFMSVMKGYKMYHFQIRFEAIKQSYENENMLNQQYSGLNQIDT